jgi:subtilisin family serine protease
MHTVSTRITAVSVVAAGLLAVAIFFGAPRPASGAEESLAPVAVPGEIIVRYDDSTSPRMRTAIAEDLDGRVVRKLRLPRTDLIKVPAESVDDAIEALEQQPGVLSAEPNVRVHLMTTPDDAYFPYLWGLENSGQTAKSGITKVDADIDAPEAWNRFTGNGQVKVAVIDTGVDYNHPDLVGSVTGGYDFIANDPDPMDEHYHGTHVSGTIGAHGNNGTGVTGVNWNVQILAVRVFDAEGSTTLDAIVNGIVFAGQQGARVANMSFGGYGHSDAITAAIAGAPNTLFVAAAGNETNNNDKNAVEPCNVPAPNVLCVAATDANDRLASFSNFGRRTVDLAAPGVDILSTVPTTYGEYGVLSGTSMATPHAAGVAALALGLVPDLTTAELKLVLMKSVDRLPKLKKKCVTGGRLNADKALQKALSLRQGR